MRNRTQIIMIVMISADKISIDHKIVSTCLPNPKSVLFTIHLNLQAGDHILF